MTSKTKQVRKTANKAKKTVRKTSAKVKGKSRSLVKMGLKSALKLPVEDIRGQLLNYGDQIQQYLAKVNAKVESFNFGVEKETSGITIDCQIKATIGA